MSYSGIPMIRARKAEHHLLVDERLMDLLKTYSVIVLDDEDFSAKLTWCLENCQSKFRDLSENGRRSWYFQNEQDAAMFAMKWS
jgi:hypothetical protein